MSATSVAKSTNNRSKDSLASCASNSSSYHTPNETKSAILVCDVDKNRTITLSDRRKMTAIHKTFDLLRAEYGIEKVPSKGSSYVAITRHQTLEMMVRFAAACQRKLRSSILSSMSNGCDDDILRTMRFGIHVGPITSVVADEARELNADHINLPSSIEKAMFLQTTSEPGQIQICKASAKQLKANGMDLYLNRRTDGRLVFATYWLQCEFDENNNSIHVIPLDV